MNKQVINKHIYISALVAVACRLLHVKASNLTAPNGSDHEVGNPGPKFHTPLAEREEAACGDVQRGINPIMTKHNLHLTEDVPA